MRRDVTHYYEKSVPEVFEAYRAAAMQKFGKNSRAEPYHTLSFGLNYSMKYNMNGGACTVHFMPYMTGTAVDVRFTIAQLAGARYKAYDKDLTDYVVRLLGVPAADLAVGVDLFLQAEHQVTAAPAPMSAPAPAPAPAPVPMPSPAPAPAAKFCTRCGSPLIPGARFCGKCGQPVGQTK